MRSKTGIIIFTATALFTFSTLAANATTVSPTGCVDSSSMSSCLQTVQDQLTTCLDEAGGNDDVILACQWEQWVQQMVCYQASCWNKAYSCEYQYIVSEYKAQRTVDETIPFYPAPDNAPGGCSCSLGQVFTNATGNIDGVSQCEQYVGALSDDLDNCQCCAYSAAVSAFYGICPNTSPDGLGVTAFDSTAAAYETTVSSCAGLTAELCASYGFWSADNGTFLDPTNLPSAGTQALSTTAGPSSLTTPPAGATITWTALNQTFTVTASAYDAKNVAAGSTTTGTGVAAITSGTSSSGGSGTTTTTTGKAASSATSTGAASSIWNGNQVWAVGMFSLGGLLVAL